MLVFPLGNVQVKMGGRQLSKEVFHSGCRQRQGRIQSCNLCFKVLIRWETYSDQNTQFKKDKSNNHLLGHSEVSFTLGEISLMLHQDGFDIGLGH